MFLQKTEKRNPQLIDYARYLHQEGYILPDTYVLDVDTIVENTKKIVKEAKKQDIQLFYMTKQFGRNPYVAQKIREAGIDQAVVVDFKEARIFMEHRLPIGHIGHIVQVPVHLLQQVIEYGVEIITSYSVEMLWKINNIARKRGIKQKIMLRIIQDDAPIYPGQEAGFLYQELPALIVELKKMTHVIVAGVTTFPCFLYDEVQEDFVEVAHVGALQRAKKILEQAGFTLQMVNLPSGTCEHTLRFIKKMGGTHGEPGHALTGTTPMHATKDLAEKPAMVYVSEVSHHFREQSFIYGGGYYPRGHFKSVLTIDQEGRRRHYQMNPFSAENIDYYLGVQGLAPIGATVIAAFRTQIFMMRSDVALVEGLREENPKFIGIYDSQGRRRDE